MVVGKRHGVVAAEGGDILLVVLINKNMDSFIIYKIYNNYE
jgi:hypothetical protein